MLPNSYPVNQVSLSVLAPQIAKIGTTQGCDSWTSDGMLRTISLGRIDVRLTTISVSSREMWYSKLGHKPKMDVFWQSGK